MGVGGEYRISSLSRSSPPRAIANAPARAPPEDEVDMWRSDPEGSSRDTAKKLRGRLRSKRLPLRNRMKKKAPAAIKTLTPKTEPRTMGKMGAPDDFSGVVVGGMVELVVVAVT